jgi:hypothetical protein
MLLVSRKNAVKRIFYGLHSETLVCHAIGLRSLWQSRYRTCHFISWLDLINRTVLRDTVSLIVWVPRPIPGMRDPSLIIYTVVAVVIVVCSWASEHFDHEHVYLVSSSENNLVACWG